MGKKNNLNQIQLSNELKEKFAMFIEYAPPKRFSRNLRQLLLWYLVYEEEAPPFDLKELAADLVLLFELLDLAEAEAAFNKKT